METYSILRAFADSWVLLAMTLFFLGVILWAFRRGSGAVHSDAAGIPFRNENRPAGQEPHPRPSRPQTQKGTRDVQS